MTVMRTKLADRVLPNYTNNEERFNSLSHLFGALLSLIGMIFCIIHSISISSTLSLVASIIYGASNILLFTMSGTYHGLKVSTTKKVFQIFDHCTIYLMIAGTYTPIILCGIFPINATAGMILMGVEWGLALLGIVLNSIDLKRYKAFSLALYLIMGWAVLPMFPIAVQAIGLQGFLWILAGGVVYSIGAILYGIGAKKSIMHSIFHVCVVLACVLQFIGIYFFVL